MKLAHRTPKSNATIAEVPSTPVPRRLIDLTDRELIELLDERTVRAPEPEWMDRTGLAQWLDISLPTVDRMCREGMPYVRLGSDGVRRFARPEIKSWLIARTQAGEP